MNVDRALPQAHLASMDTGTAAESDQQAGSSARIVRKRITQLPPAWRRTGGIALVCYAVVAVFGVAYGIVRLVSPDTSVSIAVTWGICAAGPLALALLWERLTGFKVFGIEVTLAQVVVRPDATLATALSGSEQQYFTGNKAIPALIDKIIANPSIELLELNLRTTPYWWSTRLYLQAALVEDYTNIQRLVFVDGDTQRRYVGMAGPGEVRRALAQPPGLNLERAYREIQNDVRQNPEPSDDSEAWRIVHKWTEHGFSREGELVQEGMAKTLMTAELLIQQVRLERDSVEWDNPPLDSALLQALVLDKGVRFIPLTQNGQLGKVVNSDAFARQLATRALRARLR